MKQNRARSLLFRITLLHWLGRSRSVSDETDPSTAGQPPVDRTRGNYWCALEMGQCSYASNSSAYLVLPLKHLWTFRIFDRPPVVTYATPMLGCSATTLGYHNSKDYIVVESSIPES